MPEFQRVDRPYFAPMRCAGCSTHSHPGGFVDLVADIGTPIVGDDRPYGHLYWCASCTETAGRKVGMIPKDAAAELKAQIAERDVAIDRLLVELEEERGNKLVSLEDVKELIRQRGGRPPSPQAA